MITPKHRAAINLSWFSFIIFISKNATDVQAVDSSASGRTQRKRPHIVDTAETGQTKRSKKSKQSSSSKTCIAASGRDHATNKNDTRTPSDNDQPIIKRKKQVIPTGSLSSSESEGSLHLSDQSDSLHVTVCNTGELGEQSDRKFLQQQIKILKTQFQLENDCPALSRIKGVPYPRHGGLLKIIRSGE